MKYDLSITCSCFLVSILQTKPAPATAPIPRVGSPSTTTSDGYIWLFSGRGGIDMKPVEEEGSLWRYNVAANEWISIQPATDAPYPSGRSYHCIASNGVDKIYIHSGCPEAGRLTDLWVFDIPSRTWTELPSAPPPARGGASIAYLNGKVYRMNGFDGKTELGGAIDVFDTAANSWGTITYKPDGVEGPIKRSVAALLPVVVQDTEFIVTLFGERDPSSLGHAGAGKMLPDVWAWDVKQGTWQQLLASSEDVPEARGWFDACVFKGRTEGAVAQSDVVVVHGGLNEENLRLGDVWKLTWKER